MGVLCVRAPGGAGGGRGASGARRAGGKPPRAAPTDRLRWGGDDGSQSVEFALTLPLIVLAVSLVLHVALVATDLVAAQSVAFQAARVAAVDDDEAVRAAVSEAAGNRPVEVQLDPPTERREVGQMVTASVRVRSAAFDAFGLTVWLPGTAVLRVERR